MATRKRKDVADRRPGRDVPDEPAELHARWWKQTGRDASLGLLAWVDTRRSFLRGYNTLDLIHEAIYEGRPVGRRLSTAAMDFLRAQSQAYSYLNVLQSMVDTVVARQVKRRPMPVIGCDDAEYSEKLYARRGSRVLRRKMGAPGVEKLWPMVTRDGVVRGDGFVQRIRIGGDVGIEKFPRSELVFDDGECRDGIPLRIARAKRVDKDRLAAQYPEHAARIRKAQPAARDYWDPSDYDAPVDTDQIEVTMGWSLPTSPGADDGLHLVAIRDGGKPLEERPWTCPRLPFARVQWTPGMRGFLSIGLIQQLAGSQSMVNELWGDHQEALRWASSLTIFNPRGSNIDKHQQAKRGPKIVEFDGAVPQYIAANPASTQAMDSLRWLIQQMYEISGVSQASAASRNPLGPNASGKALDSMADLESDRFSLFELQCSMGRVEVGQILLDGAVELAADKASGAFDGDLARWIDAIEWEKFDFDGGNHHLNIEPINFLPETRAGKLDALSDMAKIPGLLNSPLITASMFEEPDIARTNRHILGPMRQLEKVAEMLGDLSIPQEDCAPTPYMLSPPGLALEVIKGEHDNAFAEGASDEHLGRYRWFLQMLEGEEARAAPAAATPLPAGAPAGPMPVTPPVMDPDAPPMPPPGAAGFPDPMAGMTSQLAAGMSPDGMPMPLGVS